MSESVKLNNIILKYSKKYYKILFFLFLLVLSNKVVASIFIPNALSNIIKLINTESKNISNYLILIIVFILLYIFSVIIDTALDYLWGQFSVKIENYDALIENCNTILNYPYKFFIDNSSGKIANDIEALSSNTGRLIFSIFVHFSTHICILLVLSTYFCIKYNAYLGIFTIFWSVLFSFLTLRLAKNVSNSYTNVGKTISNLNGVIYDIIVNIFNIKIFSNEKCEIENIKKSSIECGKSKILSEKSFRDENLIRSLISILFEFLLLLVLILNYVYGNIKINDFFFIFYSIREIENNNTQFTKRLGTFINLYSETKAHVSIFNDKYNKFNKVTKQMLVADGKIEFKGVDFRYK